MDQFINSRLLFSPILLVLLWLSVRAGNFFHSIKPLEPEEREDFGVILTATLTLLFLIIGFSFSLAASRFDERMSLEAAEANAIGTEYTRADLLPPADSQKVRALLNNYLNRRIRFYRTRDRRQLREISAATSQVEIELWSSVRSPAEAQPTPVIALTVSGMNDVLNSRGYTEAAWLNRIPTGAWLLMTIIAVCSNLLVGYGANRDKQRRALFLVLPLVISIAFYIIADIDSPRSGIIRVSPLNLISLSASLNGNEVRD
jgi:hypothetical protein